MDLQLAGFDLGVVEDIVDDARQRLSGVHGDVQFSLLFIVEGRELEKFHHAQQTGQGRANLVAHGRKEVRLGLVRVFGLFLCLSQQLFGLFTHRDVAHDAGVRGIGAALYSSLFDMLRKAGYHTVLGVIALPNAASIALHVKFGMRQVAHFREVGFKFGKWHDVGNWQVVL